MKFGLFILIIGFMLDGLFSSFFPFQVNNVLLFKPMFTITSFILVHPFFNKENDKFYKSIIFIGFLYDVVYTNTLPLNMCIFFLLAVSVKNVNSILSNNIINVIVMTVFTITIFEFLNFLILNTINYTTITLYDVFYKISNSLTLNIIYAATLYSILNVISTKYKIKKID